MDVPVSTPQLAFLTALVWRPDGGADQVLYSATLGTYLNDAGYNVLAWNQNLPAVPASCGDELVLQITQLNDAGEVFEAFPRLSIP